MDEAAFLQAFLGGVHLKNQDTVSLSKQRRGLVFFPLMSFLNHFKAY